MWDRTGVSSVLAALLLVVSAVVVPAQAAMIADGSIGGQASVVEQPQTNETAVQSAVADSRSHLMSLRRDDHWASNVSSGENGIWDIRFSLYYAIMLEDLDANPESKRAAFEWTLSQRENGGWNDTVSNYAALLYIEMTDSDRYATAASEIRAQNERRNISLVATDASSDQTFVEDNFRLKLLYALKSDRYTTDELFGNTDPTAFSGLAGLTPAFEDGLDPNKTFVVPDTVDLTLSMTLLGLAVQQETGAADNASEQINLTANLLLGRRLPNGVWATTIDNVYIVLALHQAGYNKTDPEVARALEQMRTTRQADNGRVIGFKLPVWDTAWSMEALMASGVSADNETLQSSAQWLYEARVAQPLEKRGETPLNRLPLPFRKHWGNGWGYKPYMYSDWDDTSVAVASLAPYDDGIVEDDVGYLFTVQNSDGSWSAFMTDFEPLNESEREMVIDQGGKELYTQLFTNHPAPDVTGHALTAVGRNGHTVENNESVRAALEYLERAQTDDGTWDAVWGRSPAYGTSRVLLGMRAVEADMDQPMVTRAVEGLKAKQNDDGGWGVRAGAPSEPTYTAWALQAMLAAGRPADDPAVQRAVSYLLATQQADGSWETTKMMHNLRRLQYSLSVFTQASVLLALSMYAERAEIPVDPDDSQQEPSGLPMWLIAVLAELAVAGGALLVVRTRGWL